MKVVSSVQAIEAILNSERVNLAWDATSLNGKHINEVHVSTDSGIFLLDISELSGGTAENYHDHILTALGNASTDFAKSRKLDSQVILQDVRRRISSTMSDRAIVNTKTVRLLEQTLGKDLLMLNCNVHPLDGISLAFRKGLREYERDNQVKKALFGKESTVVNLVQNIAKLRFKQGKGDPSGMKAFLEKEKISKGAIVRYVGNRFHVLFHLCAQIYMIRDSLKKYLTSYACNSSQYRQCILDDLGNEITIKELQVGALLGKVLTGPWMKVLYRKSMNNLETSKILQIVMDNLRRLLRTPRLLWDVDFKLFETEYESGRPGEHSLLVGEEPDSTSLQIATVALEEIIKTLERQLDRYIDGELSNPTEEQIVQATNSTADNIAAESILGLADNLARRAPNSTYAHLTSKTMFSINHTQSYLSADTSDLICAAVTQGRIAKARSILAGNETRLLIRKRLETKGQDRDNRIRKKTTKLVREAIKTPTTFKAVLQNGLENTVEDERLNISLDFIKRPNLLVGCSFRWIWSCQQGSAKEYFYKCIKLRKTKTTEGKYIGVYWEHGGTFDEAEDETIFDLADFITDYILGDVIL